MNANSMRAMGSTGQGAGRMVLNLSDCCLADGHLEECGTWPDTGLVRHKHPDAIFYSGSAASDLLDTNKIITVSYCGQTYFLDIAPSALGVALWADVRRFAAKALLGVDSARIDLDVSDADFVPADQHLVNGETMWKPCAVTAFPVKQLVVSTTRGHTTCNISVGKSTWGDLQSQIAAILTVPANAVELHCSTTAFADTAIIPAAAVDAIVVAKFAGGHVLGGGDRGGRSRRSRADSRSPSSSDSRSRSRMDTRSPTRRDERKRRAEHSPRGRSPAPDVMPDGVRTLCSKMDDMNLNLNKRFDTIEGSLGDVKQQLAGHEKRFTSVENRLASLEKAPGAGPEAVAAMERRIVETVTTQQQGTIDASLDNIGKAQHMMQMKQLDVRVKLLITVDGQDAEAARTRVTQLVQGTGLVNDPAQFPRFVDTTHADRNGTATTTLCLQFLTPKLRTSVRNALAPMDEASGRRKQPPGVKLAMLRTPFETAQDDEFFRFLNEIKADYTAAGIPHAWIYIDRTGVSGSGKGRSICHSNHTERSYRLAWQGEYSSLIRRDAAALAAGKADALAALALPVPEEGQRHY